MSKKYYFIFFCCLLLKLSKTFSISLTFSTGKIEELNFCGSNNFKNFKYQ